MSDRETLLRALADAHDRDLLGMLFVDADGENEPTLWFPVDGRPDYPEPLFRRCDVGETGWAVVLALLTMARRQPPLPGVAWTCPRCGKTATVVGALDHVRCTCGAVSPSPHPVKLEPGRTIPSRRTDPATSHKAEAAVTIKAGTQRARLLAAFALEAAAEGLTDEEAADLADGVPYRSEFAKRCSELRAGGFILPTGHTRPGVAGHERIVSRITDAGRAALARSRDARTT